MGTKLHLALSGPAYVSSLLSGAQRQDVGVAPELMSSWPWKKVKSVIADKGYDSNPLHKLIKQHRAAPVIPYRSSRWFPGTYDKKLYRTRHAIERCFGKLKENKRIAMRFDKLDITFHAFIALALIKSLHYLILC